MYFMTIFVLLIKIVRFFHLQSTKNCLFSKSHFKIPFWYCALWIWTPNTFLLLLMIVLGQLGFMSWSASLILSLFYNPFISWSKLSSTNLLRFLEKIMVLSFKWLISSRVMISYTNIVMLPLHNKILLWRGNINIFCVLQGLWEFSLMLWENAPSARFMNVGPNSREWVESCYCLSKWRFN